MSTEETAIATAADGPRGKWLMVVKKAAESFQAALPVSVDRAEIGRTMDRMIAAFRSIAASNQTIYECTPESVGRAISLSALTGLYPGGVRPDVYLIPRNNKVKLPGGREVWRKTLDWQLSFHGCVTIANRAGLMVEAVLVYDGDHFEWTQGLNPNIEHRPRLGNRTYDHCVGAYCVYRGAGIEGFVVMDRGQLDKRRAVSDSWKKGYGPWKDWPDEMAQKTVIKYASARGIIPSEMSEVFNYALRHDGGLDTNQTLEVLDATTAQVEGAAATSPALPDGGGEVVNGFEDPVEAAIAAPLPTNGAGHAPSGRGDRQPTTETPSAQPPTRTGTTPEGDRQTAAGGGVHTEGDLAGLNKAPPANVGAAAEANIEEDDERTELWEEIARLEDDLDDETKREIKAKAGITRLRGDSKLPRLRKYAAALREYHASQDDEEEEPELPAEPGEQSAAATTSEEDKLTGDEKNALHKVVNSWGPDRRKKVCEAGGVPMTGLMEPVWDKLNDEEWIRLADAVEEELDG